MKVLIGCECSGVVRRAFRDLGHDAWSCDLQPAEDASPHHFQCDVLSVLGDGWDLGIFHPECTYLCASGLHWNGRVPGRTERTEKALQFVQALLEAPIEKIALENPKGCISSRIRPPTQYVQPYDFGDDASKSTGLWLKNLPPLVPTRRVAPRIVTDTNGIVRERWGNQTDSGQNRLGPSPTRARERARTYDGIAGSMATQWGNNVG